MGEHANDLEAFGVMYYHARGEDGIGVTAAAAEKGKKYFCFDCDCEYVLRQGDIKAAHFAHKPGTGEGCSVESAMHKGAKECLFNLINAGGSITVKVKCASCKEVVDQLTFSGTAKMEYSPNSGLRIDVTVFKDGVPVLFIEIYFSHRIGDKKVERLAVVGVPWIEVYANDAIKGHVFPFNFSSHFTIVECDDCKKRRVSAEEIRRAAEEARQKKLQAEAEEKRKVEEARQRKLLAEAEEKMRLAAEQEEKRAAAKAKEDERLRILESVKRACAAGHASPPVIPVPAAVPPHDVLVPFEPDFYTFYSYSPSELAMIRSDLEPVQLEWFDRLTASEQNTWFWLSCWQQHRLGTPKQEARRTAARAVIEVRESAV